MCSTLCIRANGVLHGLSRYIPVAHVSADRISVGAEGMSGREWSLGNVKLVTLYECRVTRRIKHGARTIFPLTLGRSARRWTGAASVVRAARRNRRQVAG